MINRIAEFLKTRDESVLPDEIDDAERIGSARAILELMREPTEEMITARFQSLGSGGKLEWEAMINAALKETL